VREVKFRYRVEERKSGGKREVYSFVATMPEIEHGIPEIQGWRTKILSRDEWTGLRDKHGKEIYGSDIDRNYGEVFWCEKHCGWALRHLPVVECHHCEGNIHWTEYVFELQRDIVGNKWDNPELLEGGAA